MPKNFEEELTWEDDVGYVDINQFVDTLDLVDDLFGDNGSEEDYDA